MPADRATGTLFSLCASFCASTGLVMQKHSHNMKEWEGNSFRWRWWLGLTFITLGGVFDSLALLNAPLIDIAPLTSVTVLLNALLSSFFLNEPVGIVEICSTLLIFIGSTVTCIFGAESKEVHNIWSLIDRFGRRSFTIYITVVVCVFCVASLVLWFSQRSLARSTQRKVEPLLYGILSAMVGGIQVVLLKCIAEIFHGQFGGQEDHFQHNAVWVLCAIFVGTAVAQLLILNIGLRNCDAVHLLPVYQAFLIIVGICGGAAYFNEFTNFSRDQTVSFLSGVSLVFFGCMLLSCRDPDGNRRLAAEFIEPKESLLTEQSDGIETELPLVEDASQH